MGNDHSNDNRSMNGPISNIQIDEATQQIIDRQLTPTTRPPILFHTIHGSNITLSNNRKKARRCESFCKGLAFSSRPIDVNENVCIRLSEVGTNWSGVLRLGISNFDPESFRNISVPKFACPDLTTKEGFWAKALPERYSVQGNILHFFVNDQGDLHYGINGRQKGMFLTGINTSLPMWIIVDIYGNSIAVDFMESSELSMISQVPQPLTRTVPSNSLPTTSLISSTIPPVRPTINVQNNSTSPVVTSSAHRESSSTVATFEPIHFHVITGRHITLDATKTLATRDNSEYAQGYVFTSRPIKNNEVVKITIKNVLNLYEGGLAFGVTCCNPATLRGTDLPDDSSDLIEMPDYWVGIKDIAIQPAANTELRFWIADNGEVKFQRFSNRGTPRTVLHVDNSLALYMWFDVYGSTTAIKLSPIEAVATLSPSPVSSSQSTSFSSARSPVFEGQSSHGRERSTEPALSMTARSVNMNVAGNRADVAANSDARTSIEELLGEARITPVAEQNVPIPPRRRVVLPPRAAQRMPERTPPRTAPPRVPPMFTSEQKDEPSKSEGDGECLICFDKRINSVLYTCGHMCMCYECARQVLDMSNGTCPICRAEIRDVIKCFKS